METSGIVFCDCTLRSTETPATASIGADNVLRVIDDTGQLVVSRPLPTLRPAQPTSDSLATLSYELIWFLPTVTSDMLIVGGGDHIIVLDILNLDVLQEFAGVGSCAVVTLSDCPLCPLLALVPVSAATAITPHNVPAGITTDSALCHSFAAACVHCTTSLPDTDRDRDRDRGLSYISALLLCDLPLSQPNKEYSVWTPSSNIEDLMWKSFGDCLNVEKSFQRHVKSKSSRKIARARLESSVGGDGRQEEGRRTAAADRTDEGGADEHFNGKRKIASGGASSAVTTSDGEVAQRLVLRGLESSLRKIQAVAGQLQRYLDDKNALLRAVTSGVLQRSQQIEEGLIYGKSGVSSSAQTSAARVRRRRNDVASLVHFADTRHTPLYPLERGGAVMDPQQGVSALPSLDEEVLREIELHLLEVNCVFIPGSWSVLLVLRVENKSRLSAFCLQACVCAVDTMNSGRTAPVTSSSACVGLMRGQSELLLTCRVDLNPSCFIASTTKMTQMQDMSLLVGLRWHSLTVASSAFSAAADREQVLMKLSQVLERDPFRAVFEVSTGAIPSIIRLNFEGKLTICYRDLANSFAFRSQVNSRLLFVPHLNISRITGRVFESVDSLEKHLLAYKEMSRHFFLSYVDIHIAWEAVSLEQQLDDEPSSFGFEAFVLYMVQNSSSGYWDMDVMVGDSISFVPELSAVKSGGRRMLLVLSPPPPPPRPQDLSIKTTAWTGRLYASMLASLSPEKELFVGVRLVEKAVSMFTQCSRSKTRRGSLSVSVERGLTLKRSTARLVCSYAMDEIRDVASAWRDHLLAVKVSRQGDTNANVGRSDHASSSSHSSPLSAEIACSLRRNQFLLDSVVLSLSDL